MNAAYEELIHLLDEREVRYLPAVLSVIYGNELPKDAIRCVEAGRWGPRVTEGGEPGADH